MHKRGTGSSDMFAEKMLKNKDRYISIFSSLNKENDRLKFLMKYFKNL